MYQAVIRECWRHNSRLRPSMREVAERLRALQREERERSTFKLAAEMISGSQSTAGRTPPKKSPRTNGKSPLLPGKAPKELGGGAAWNRMWSPIKHASGSER
ncbi:MAG: hypothetical protein ABGY24_04855 [bacterium]